MRNLVLGFFILSAFFSFPALAQRGLDDEALKTLRFVRLTETREQLNFDDETLIQLNKMLDVYEAKRYKLMRKQLRVHAAIRRGYEAKDAEKLLAELISVRKAMGENEAFLWSQASQLLEPTQALEFFQFYSSFQQDIRRQIRFLKEERRKRNRHQNNRRKKNRP